MIPAFLIPVVVQVASRLIKLGFDSLEKKPESSKKEQAKVKLKKMVEAPNAPTKGAKDYVAGW